MKLRTLDSLSCTALPAEGQSMTRMLWRTWAQMNLWKSKGHSLDLPCGPHGKCSTAARRLTPALGLRESDTLFPFRVTAWTGWEELEGG